MIGSIRSTSKACPPADDESAIYVGRPSALGNPYPMAKESMRAHVVAQYRIWLLLNYKKPGKVRREILAITDQIRSGENIALQCWCAPKRCHADEIARLVINIIESEDL